MTDTKTNIFDNVLIREYFLIGMGVVIIDIFLGCSVLFRFGIQKLMGLGIYIITVMLLNIVVNDASHNIWDIVGNNF